MKRPSLVVYMLRKWDLHTYGPVEDTERWDCGFVDVFFNEARAKAQCKSLNLKDLKVGFPWECLFGVDGGQLKKLTSLGLDELRCRLIAAGLTPPKQFKDWAYWWADKWYDASESQRRSVWEALDRVRTCEVVVERVDVEGAEPLKKGKDCTAYLQLIVERETAEEVDSDLALELNIDDDDDYDVDMGLPKEVLAKFRAEH